MPLFVLRACVYAPCTRFYLWVSCAFLSPTYSFWYDLHFYVSLSFVFVVFALFFVFMLSLGLYRCSSNRLPVQQTTYRIGNRGFYTVWLRTDRIMSRTHTHTCVAYTSKRSQAIISCLSNHPKTLNSHEFGSTCAPCCCSLQQYGLRELLGLCMSGIERGLRPPRPMASRVKKTPAVHPLLSIGRASGSTRFSTS